ncbi:ADP-heptose:LPS heptosyltransferase [Ignavibacterium album JCM 16511]|uniref:ADP-heptose:LPS heptosyltransferase n=1 Tax=Ignavibacterium album (strain DSM 19864 / JCM 16511 / NBRC 101810 / Mat9-16) TaxID=945713 RepID=I0AG32_IGNAJ|nr:glycosyltransferase family 9 protein [Ignavibacterium album]AFH47939.1 ADP-heptose:LPS heptosyltransferase [Ignavibacterium album JCM 16511]
MLCSLSLYKAIKKKYPESHITLAASKTNYTIPFFEINPYINRVLIYDKSSTKTILNFYKQLCDRKYQYGFVPSTIKISRTSHIINFLSSAKIRVGVNSVDGIKNKSAFLLNLKDDFNWKNKHQLVRNLEIARLAGFDLADDDMNEIKFSFTDEEVSFAKNFLLENFKDNSKKIIAFHPGAGKKENTYPTDKFILLIKMIYKKYGNHILITSGWTDDLIINKIKSKLDKDKIQFTVAKNLPVKKLGAILSMIDLYITNDTGTMHIAGFSGAKMISLFGPTNPYEWAPRNKNSFFIKSQTEKIEDISVEEIFHLIENVIEFK